MANQPSAATIDLDAVFTAPPDLQKQMLSEILRPKIHALQPQLADRYLEQFLELDTDYVVNLALDEPTLIKVIAQIKAEIDEAANALENHINDNNSESNKEGDNISEGSISSQGNLSSRESDVPETSCGAYYPCFLSSLTIPSFMTDQLSVNDVGFQLEKRIREISMDDPWTQTQYDKDPEAQHDPFNAVYCVWISNFFTDTTNLIYYIRGTRNVEMFCGGMAGMQAFNGAALFAITHSPLEVIIHPVWPSPQDGHRPQRLVKSKSPIEANKWRYLYETGRLVWGKSGIDLDKLGQAMEKSAYGESSRSKDYHASDTDMNVDPEETHTKQERESAASERGRTKKVPMLRGGAAHWHGSIDPQFLRKSSRKKARNPDYRALHNGLDSRKEAERHLTGTSKQGDAEVRPNKLQRKRSLPSSTIGPPEVHPSGVPESLPNVALNVAAAAASASREASLPSSQKIRYTLKTPTTKTSSLFGPFEEDRTHTQTPQDLPETTPGLSRLEPDDDQDLLGPECEPPNPTIYGASVEWQSNIKQSIQAVTPRDERLKRVTDRVKRGLLPLEMAKPFLDDLHPELKYQTSGTFTLHPEDTEAAEVLSSLKSNRDSDGSSNATVSDAQPVETVPGILDADGESWLSAAIDRERDFEREQER